MKPSEARVVLPELLVRAQRALGWTQSTMGRALGASRNTVGAWQSGRSSPPEATIEALARAVHEFDAALAAGLAAAIGETLVSLRIVAPAPARGPSMRQLTDAVLCAAAEIASLPPAALRPGLLAAFECADAMGLSAADVAKGLRRESP